jgi:hypothetical protein
MNANNTFLAVFLGSKTNPRMTAWNALPEAERTWSFARTRMRLRPNSSRGIRILRSFPGKPSRSCPFSRYRAPERLRPRIELSINYA